MRNIIIYGAGYRGIDYACQLYKRGIEIAGFCDTYKIGDVSFECCGKKLKKSIIALENVNSDQDIIVIAIANKEHYIKVYDKIARYGIPVTTLDKVFPGKDIVANNREMIAEYHIDKMDDYFRRAEDEECINAFWGGGGFSDFFRELNLKKVVELACGRGRHVPQYISNAKEIILVDILNKNISYCKERFKEESKIIYYVNNGYDLSKIESDSCTALFTYDAMVHFEMLDIFQYLKETERILICGGKALFHHSNNTEDYRVTFNPKEGLIPRSLLRTKLMSNEVSLGLIPRSLLRGVSLQERMVEII